jgi:hypothetical protein
MGTSFSQILFRRPGFEAAIVEAIQARPDLSVQDQALDRAPLNRTEERPLCGARKGRTGLEHPN